MTQLWEVEYSAQAEQDIRDVYEYLAYNLHEPQSAQRVVISDPDFILGQRCR